MPSPHPLTVEKKGNAAIVAIAGFTDDHVRGIGLANRLADAASNIEMDEEVRVVVLADAPGGDAEPAGASRSGADADWVESPSFAESIARIDRPTIACITHDAIGAGLELAMACDIRIASEGSRFGLPQIKEGCMPRDGGTQRLARIVGPGKALEMILTGELIDAEDALRCGLVNRLCPKSQAMKTALAIAEELASKAPVAVRYIREAIYKGMDLTIDQGLGMEEDLYLLLFTTRDRVEGIHAFKEKRKPFFTGK